MADKINLNFKSGNKLQVALSWEPNDFGDGRATPHDLDLSCAILDQGGSMIDTITPVDPKRAQYGQVIFHSGDNTSGGSNFEDEYIRVSLDKLDANIQSLAFMVSAKKGLRFKNANAPICRFMDAISLDVFHGVDLTLVDSIGPASDIVLAGVVTREEGGWALAGTPVGLMIDSAGAIEKAVMSVML